MRIRAGTTTTTSDDDGDDDDDGTREASDARGLVAWRAKAVPTVGATATTTARFARGRGVDAALDDAKSVEALRAGYKTLLREVTARHERARRAMEEEMEALRARVRALETEGTSTAATISGSKTRMKSPRREILAPRRAGRWRGAVAVVVRVIAAVDVGNDAAASVRAGGGRGDGADAESVSPASAAGSRRMRRRR